MLFPLCIWHDTEGILDNIGKSKDSGNPAFTQADNFPVSDGEVDQPVYKGPQTQSHTRKLMKADILMNQMFNIDVLPNPEVIIQSQLLRDLILEFWYQQIFTVYKICCDLAEAGTCSSYC